MSTADAPLPVAPALGGVPTRILIVQAPYYQAVADGLLRGASALLAQAGAAFDVVDVAGALELPQAVRLALRGAVKYDGFVTLGCVVKGGTDHYEHVCREAMNGIMQVALQFGAPTANGLLTVATEAQALERSGEDGHNKGAEAAAAVLRLIVAGRKLGALT
jgi:6,7-dimethyl-8-ribityllumazine synthase